MQTLWKKVILVGFAPAMVDGRNIGYGGTWVNSIQGSLAHMISPKYRLYCVVSSFLQ